MRKEASSELLFAIIALRQGRFSSREFTDICSAWAADQSKGLRERFCERLSPAEWQALDEQVMLLLLGWADDPNRTLDQPRTKDLVFKTLGGAASLPSSSESSCGCPPDEGSVTPETPGRYEPRQELGRGGIGRVLLAFDAHIGREIALKEIIPDILPDKDSGEDTPSHPSHVVRARFLRESRVTGQLEHPSIVPVYEIGRRPGGTCYYTMRMVKGRTLARAITQCVDLEERLKLLPHFYDMCNAIAYAHSRQVLHRDIKPDNVMIGEFGETVVLDWGLAKVKGQKDHGARNLEKRIHLLKDMEASKTMSGRVIGTPAYMPPEQALGDIENIDERSDLYSLGAVLYEILTGVRPFKGGSAYEVLGKVMKEKPADIRVLEPAAPIELAAIAEKAMQKDKGLRYQQVPQMTQDIQNYLAGGRVSAYRYSTIELVGKFLRNHKAFRIDGAHPAADRGRNGAHFPRISAVATITAGE
jgi:serine/threonine protein kinase